MLCEASGDWEAAGRAEGRASAKKQESGLPGHYGGIQTINRGAWRRLSRVLGRFVVISQVC
jgi:hypothetical protein